MLTGIPSARMQSLRPQAQDLLPKIINGKIIEENSINLNSLSYELQKKILSPIQINNIEETMLSNDLLKKINKIKIIEDKINEDKINKKTLEEIIEDKINEKNLGEQIIQRIEIPLNNNSITEHHLSDNILKKLNKEFIINKNSINTEHLSNECISNDKISKGCITKDKLSKDIKTILDTMNNKIKNLEKQIKELKNNNISS